MSADVHAEPEIHPDDAPIAKESFDIDPREIELLELNARFMRKEVFDALVDDIRRDGCLTGQTPFLVWNYDTERWRVLSGNHRVKGAIEAGLDTIHVEGTKNRLSEDRKTAIQLAQNAISGEDDPTILKQLYESIENVDFRQYTGLDDKTLGMIEAIDMQGLSEANLKFTTISLVFLPDEVDEAKEVLEDAVTIAAADERWTARMSDYDDFIGLIQTAQSSYKIGNTATAFMILVEVLKRHIGELREGWWDSENDQVRHDGLVQLQTVIGQSYLPSTAAAVVQQALKRMVKEGHVDEHNLARGLELLAADYLAGPGID